VDIQSTSAAADLGGIFIVKTNAKGENRKNANEQNSHIKIFRFK